MNFDLAPELTGEHVHLRPLFPADFDALYAAASDPLIWEGHPAGADRHELAAFTRFFDKRIAAGGALLATDAQTGEVIGTSSFYDLDPAADTVAIGWTFLVRARWDGRTNAEMKRLMFAHAHRFVESVLLWVNPDNARSQRAVAKVGGVHEGQHEHIGHAMERFRVRRIVPAEFGGLPVSQFAFPGPLRDRLVGAILSGAKTTTSSLLEEYVDDPDELPRVGDRRIVIDSDEHPVAVIEIVAVDQVPLGDIDLQFAIDEGEGFRTVAEWRAGHERFWTSDELVAELGHAPDLSDTALVVAERFRVLWTGTVDA